MKNEPLHNVLSYSDWPQVPPRQAQDDDPSVEVDLSIVVREVLNSVRQDSSPRVTERQARIRNFRSATYELIDDLVVTVEETDDGFIARSYDTGQYGVGVSADDAIEHLCSVLEDYFELLKEERGNLSRPLESHLRYLEAILKAL